MTTLTAPAARPRRLLALATAEKRQFVRNRTLMFMGIAFPIGLPLVTYFTGRDQTNEATILAVSWELFAVMALLFVQYYSVLSMITTRRGEGVLKRLRTGEARDWQILAAPALPGVGLTLITAVVVGAVIYGSGAPMPVNPVVMLIALLGGVVTFTLLALATSAFTKNAEAAQVTSLPVMMVSMMGLSTLRQVLPERLAQFADWTPFAAVADLMSYGASGRLSGAPEGEAARDFAGVFAEIGMPLATLGVWTVVTLVLAVKNFRWDDRG